MPACFLKVSTEVDMKYKHLFFDLDHTIWDFDANSRVTLADLYEEFNLYSIGVTDFEQFYLNYLEQLKSCLLSAGASPEITDRINQVLSACEWQLYTPSMDPDEVSRIRNEAIEILDPIKTTA